MPGPRINNGGSEEHGRRLGIKEVEDMVPECINGQWPEHTYRYNSDPQSAAISLRSQTITPVAINPKWQELIDKQTTFPLFFF